MHYFSFSFLFFLKIWGNHLHFVFWTTVSEIFKWMLNHPPLKYYYYHCYPKWSNSKPWNCTVVCSGSKYLVWFGNVYALCFFISSMSIPLLYFPPMNEIAQYCFSPLILLSVETAPPHDDVSKLPGSQNPTEQLLCGFFLRQTASVTPPLPP